MLKIRVSRITLPVLVSLLLMFAIWPGASLPLAAQIDETAQIAVLLDQMEAAVLTQDQDTYLSYVDLSDPVFALEHTRWTDDWAGPAPVDVFELDAENIQLVDDEAITDLTMTWSLVDDSTTISATYPARFRRGEDEVWRYAGELWVTLETEYFQVHARPGLEEAAERLSEALPDIYQHATQSLGYEPETIMQIKLYDSPEALVANVLLSLPPILGWNEPGESLKMLASPDEIPASYVLAHELTHFLTFEMAGSTHGNFTWWVEEGIAEYVASHYGPASRYEGHIARVLNWHAEAALAPWDAMADFETTPYELWQYVYPQGYVFVIYVTETFGEEARNDWLWAMAGEMTLPEATEAVLGFTFDELDQGFDAWLDEQ
jgi:hypothetical protein